MRIPMIAGNWKMNTTVSEAVELVRAMQDELDKIANVDKVICPPFVSLAAVSELIKGSSIKLGAQNLFFVEKGAYTGEISAQMLLTCGCEYVILGHSERRTYFGEIDATVNNRLKASLAAGLIPIVCVGETLEERKTEVTEKVIRKQVTGAFEGLAIGDVETVVVAYEPVWAIGTGLTATPEQAEAVHAFIRQVLGQLYSTDAASVVRIQYGGSVKPENAVDLLSRPNIDGGLIGGAALDADSFAAIIKAAL